MTRFIFIADTHCGSTEKGYQQQKRYPDNIPGIIEKLDDWIRQDASIDFVLHGGDMIDFTSKENILNAVKFFSLSVPVYLCLGNHDLTKEDALDMWLTYAPSFFPEGKPNYVIRHKDITVYVIPNHWCEHPYYWEEELFPHFREEQFEFITNEVKRPNKQSGNTDCYRNTNCCQNGSNQDGYNYGSCNQGNSSNFHHDNETEQNNEKNNISILCTHGIVAGVPAEQTGYETDIHVPPESFRNEVKEIIMLDPRIKCVLSGHSHINTNVRRDGVYYVTASSLTEVPFEFKLIEVDSTMLKISTIPLAPYVSFSYEYNYDRTYVQGREKDRMVIYKWEK